MEIGSIKCNKLSFSKRNYSFFIIPKDYLEGACQILVHIHHSTRIIELATVIGCTKNCHKSSICYKFISLLYYLMGTTN